MSIKIWIFYCNVLYWFCFFYGHSYCRCITTGTNHSTHLYLWIYFQFSFYWRDACALTNDFCIFKQSSSRNQLINRCLNLFSRIRAPRKTVCRRKACTVFHATIKWKLLHRGHGSPRFSTRFVECERESESRTLDGFAMIFIFDVTFSVQRKNAHNFYECDCMCSDCPVSWKNSNRCQTNSSTISHYSSVALFDWNATWNEYLKTMDLIVWWIFQT